MKIPIKVQQDTQGVESSTQKPNLIPLNRQEIKPPVKASKSDAILQSLMLPDDKAIGINALKQKLIGKHRFYDNVVGKNQGGVADIKIVANAQNLEINATQTVGEFFITLRGKLTPLANGNVRFFGLITTNTALELGQSTGLCRWPEQFYLFEPDAAKGYWRLNNAPSPCGLKHNIDIYMDKL